MKFLTLLCMAAMAFATPFSKTGGARVEGGTKVRPGEFKFMVAVENLFGDFLCGGVLINKDTVLTGAECGTGLLGIGLLIRVRVGSLQKGQGGQVFSVLQKIRHPLFDQYGHQEFDIAILKLVGKITVSDQVSPIDLYSGTDLEGKYVTAAGWGNKDGSIDLYKMTQRVISFVQCQNYQGSTLYSDDKFCAVNGKLCPGDYGGPAVINENSVTKLAGLVGFNNDCNNLYGSDRYLNTSYVKTWVDQNSQ